MGEMTKSTRRTQKTTLAGKTVTSTSIAAGDPPEVERIPSDDSDLARLLSTPEWEVIGALEALFEAAPESITVYDLDGRIVLANAAFHASVARLFPGDRPAKLRDRMAQH